MKNIFIVILFSLFTITSCTQNQQDEGFESFQEELGSNFPDLLRMQYNLDFKNDFICSETVSKPTALAHKYIAKYRSDDEMIALFPQVKEDFENSLEEKQAIQSIGLKYLRRYFIPSETDESKQHTKYLLNTLINAGCIDLDVLVDAYIKVETLLTEEEKVIYKNHFNWVYNKHRTYLDENFELLKNTYLNAEGNAKTKALLDGKHAERLSKTLEYCSEYLDFEGQN